LHVERASHATLGRRRFECQLLHEARAHLAAALPRSVQRVRSERHVSALERVQMTLAVQLEDPFAAFLASALVALRPLPEIPIRRLAVTWSSRHVLTPPL